MKKEKHLDRRDFLKMTASAAVLATALGGLYEMVRKEGRVQSAEPVDTDAILDRVRELDFAPGAELRGTILPRKIMWELVQVRKLRGQWEANHDESDWLAQPEIFGQALDTLAQAGITGGRLAIFSSELTTDGEHFNWEPLDAAIASMNRRNLAVELSAGPLDYPYDPGIRLPQAFRDQLRDEARTSGTQEITVGLQPDSAFPQSSQALRDFSLQFWRLQLERYGSASDQRVEKFYLANEWPDVHGIEGVEGVRVRITEDLMLELIRLGKSLTQKKIAVNTNIHVSEPGRLRQTFGPLLNELGDQGVLGFDLYPTREAENWRLRRTMDRYAELMQTVRHDFPQTEIVSTEFQAEPWPPSNLTGDSWAQIFTQHPDLIWSFYEQVLPRSLETHAVAAELREIGIWGLPTMLVLAELGYDFPLRLMRAARQAMDAR